MQVPREPSIRTLQARIRYHAWVTQRLGGPRRSPARVIIGLLLMATGVLIPVGLLLVIKGLMRRNPHAAALAEELAFIERAELVMASPLMVNSLLRQPGDKPVPGLFMVSFEGEEVETPEFMSDVALAVTFPSEADIPEADVRGLEALMADETFRRGRRQQLPASVTQGRVVYACDLGVHPWYLRDRHLPLSQAFVPCLAEPGATGQARVIPYWCAEDVPPPEIAGRCPVFVG